MDTTVRELRNHGGQVIERVLAGEEITVTRDGHAVARLVPVSRPRQTAAVLVERFRRLPAVDPDRLRRDIDAVVDQRL